MTDTRNALGLAGSISEGVKEVVKVVESPARRKLPDERESITHKFDISGHEGYITVGLFDDGTPGEIFLVMAKEGSTISGFADAFAQAISYALQYGVPLRVLVDKFSHARFEPSGMTKNNEIRFAKSIVDYIHVGVNLNKEDSAEALSTPVEPPVPAQTDGLRKQILGEIRAFEGEAPSVEESEPTSHLSAIQNQEDAPPCSTCGAIMIRSGACYKCLNCGTTSGCA